MVPNTGSSSAHITLTDEYIVINGGHQKILNGYSSAQHSAVSVARADVLGLEKQTLRDKRKLVIGMVLFGFAVLLQGILDSWGTAIELGHFLGFFSKDSIFTVFRVIMTAGCIVPAIILVGIYSVRPSYVFRISSLGGEYMVETKHYELSRIDALMFAFYNPQETRKAALAAGFDVFLSYRRDGGETMAILLKDRLSAKGYRVFLDIEGLNSGSFNTKLLFVIEECTDFVFVGSKGSLDRCANEGDWVRLEIAHALRHSKNIVPIMLRDFEFPATLPEEIDSLRVQNGVNANSHEYFDAAIDRLAEKFLKSKPV